MIRRIDEPEAICAVGPVVMWRVTLNDVPSLAWRRNFLERARRIFGRVGSGTWIAGAALLFELERPSLRIGLEQIDGWICEANQAEGDMDGTSRETVLVVGADPDVRTLAYEILEDQGFTVLDTGDPHDALAIAQLHRVDLLLADATMPGMTGPELAGRVEAASPDTRVLFMCAGAEDAELAGGTSYITTRFSIQELVVAVRRALSERPACSKRTSPSR